MLKLAQTAVTILYKQAHTRFPRRVTLHHGMAATRIHKHLLHKVEAGADLHVLALSAECSPHGHPPISSKYGVGDGILAPLASIAFFIFSHSPVCTRPRDTLRHHRPSNRAADTQKQGW